ncbi:MAG: hypothetical protein EOM42_07510 [Negativicutes bacterium]|nr:hypothetical protein [Negativicutes bacterium]
MIQPRSSIVENVMCQSGIGKVQFVVAGGKRKFQLLLQRVDQEKKSFSRPIPIASVELSPWDRCENEEEARKLLFAECLRLIFDCFGSTLDH